MKHKKKVPTTTRALVQRINRRLRDQDEILKTPRGSARYELGDYYVLNVSRNYIVEKDVDPEKFGRKLAVLQDWEALAD